MTEIRTNCCIVLVEPQSPGNVGMVCRAMKNMGLRELRLVNPCPIDHPEALKFAVSAKDLLETAIIFPTLDAALADCPFSVATTRRLGKYRQEIHSPEEIATRIRTEAGDARTALVFGREADGLTTEEVARCRWQASIPTSAEYGSLNLAQAVLIFSYELFKGAGTVCAAPAERDLAEGGELESLFQHMERSLLRIGFLNPENPAHIMRTLRRIYARAELDRREAAVLRGMLSQMDWATAAFEGKKGR